MNLTVPAPVEEQATKKDKLESDKVVQRIYSTTLNEEEVEGLTPMMNKLFDRIKDIKTE